MTSIILGIGIDLVEVDRIADLHQRYGERFISRFCAPGEPQRRRGAALAQHLSGLFAAKEAVLKALGTGWGRGVALRDVRVARDEHGSPCIELAGAAALEASGRGVERVHVSITHERGMAAAVAVLEGGDGAGGR